MEFTKEIWDNLLLQIELAHKKIDLVQSVMESTAKVNDAQNAVNDAIDERIKNLLQLITIHGNKLFPEGKTDSINDIWTEINSLRETIQGFSESVLEGLEAQRKMNKITFFLIGDYLTRIPKLSGIQQSDLISHFENETGIKSSDVSHLFVVK